MGTRYKVVTIIGARPQFVKAAVVSRVLRTRCQEVLVHTGQHYDHEMSGAFFEDLQIPEPDYNLAIGSGSHGRQTGEMLGRLEQTLIDERPDMVLIYGDTNSTLAGALAAAKLHIPIAHVEAGPRNFSMRVPEEVNRLVADRLSALFFCATQTSVANLHNEGYRDGVVFTGDVMLDLHLAMRERALESDVLERLGVEHGRYVLATIHRPRNTDIDDRVHSIFGALMEIDEPVVLPLHPRAVSHLQRVGWYEKVASASHIRLTKPQGYLDFLRLELGARAIVTDSGGVQREAYFCQRPCVTLFPNTAWPETVDEGWNLCVDADKDRILDAVRTFVPDSPQTAAFGDGHAGEKIVDEMLKYLADPRPIYA